MRKLSARIISLSSNLQKKKSKKFTVTRYLHQENVGNVYYGSRQSRRKKQSIETFHADLSKLQLIWLDDPLISQRTRPTNTEMKQMLLHALGCQSLLKDGEVQLHHAKYVIKNGPLASLVAVLKEWTDKSEAKLLALRSLEKVLMTKKMHELRRQNPNALNYGHMDKNYDKYMLFEYVEDLESAQLHQFEMHNQVIDDALLDNDDHRFPVNSIDSNELRAIFNEFSSAWENYREELDADRKDKWAYEENFRMFLMRAGLSDYFDAAGVSAQDKNICLKEIASPDYDLKTVLRTKQNVQKIKMQQRKIQTDTIEIVNSMDASVAHLVAVRQKIWKEKIKW